MFSSERIILTDPRGNNYSLKNRFRDIIKLKDAVEDAKDAKGLVKSINALSDYGVWEVYKDGKDVTIFKTVDTLGNIEYLKVRKSDGKASGFTKVRLTNPSNVNFALSNDFKDELSFREELKDCDSVEDAIKAANKNALYRAKWSLDRKSSNKVRLVSKDALGNIHYLELVKESLDMEDVKESFDNIRVPNLSNQPMTVAGVGAGMPTRWVWAEYGRFLNAYGIRNGFNITFNLESALDIKNKLAYLYQKRDEGLINSDDLQELEERLRTLSDFVIGGNDNQSGAAIEEIEYDDMTNESVVIIDEKKGNPLSSKYSYAVTLFDKDKMKNKDYTPWSILSLADDGTRDNKGRPWTIGAFGNKIIDVKSGNRGAKDLYLLTDKDISILKKAKSEEDVVNYIMNKGTKVNPSKVDYDMIFDIKVDEEVKPSTSEKQLQHLREIQPLSHSEEANAKRAKTIKERQARKMINAIDEEDLK